MDTTLAKQTAPAEEKRGRGRPRKGQEVTEHRTITVGKTAWGGAQDNARHLTGEANVSELVRLIGTTGQPTAEGGLYIPPVEKEQPTPCQ